MRIPIIKEKIEPSFVIINGEKISKICMEVGYKFHGDQFLKHVKDIIKYEKTNNV